MGTTSRGFNPSLHRAKMSHHANIETRGVVHHMTKQVKKVKPVTVIDKIKVMAIKVFNFFGLFKSSPKWKEITFPTHFHSPHLCGKRDDIERSKRKQRRAKRQRLIANRGWA